MIVGCKKGCSYNKNVVIVVYLVNYINKLHYSRYPLNVVFWGWARKGYFQQYTNASPLMNGNWRQTGTRTSLFQKPDCSLPTPTSSPSSPSLSFSRSGKFSKSLCQEMNELAQRQESKLVPLQELMQLEEQIAKDVGRCGKDHFNICPLKEKKSFVPLPLIHATCLASNI